MNEVLELDTKEIIEGINLERCFQHTFLITGATGAVGRYIVYTLLRINREYPEKKCKIIIMARSIEKVKTVFGGIENDSQVKILIQNVEEPLDLIDKVDYIFHAACFSATRMFKLQPVDIIKTNIIGTNSILSWCIEKNLKGILFFSSGAVYGEGIGSEPCEKEEDLCLLEPLEANECYSVSKCAGENLCISYVHQYHLPIKIVRMAHTYGPGMDLNDGHVYSDFVRNIINNETIIIREDGMDRRAFCYITDAVIGFFKILFDGNSGEAYNIANNNELLTIKELAAVLVEKAFPEKKLSYMCIKKGNQTVDKYMNTDKLQEMGWQPLVSVSEGFQRVVKYLTYGVSIN